MSEGGEGVPIPEEAKKPPKVEFDKYGQIIGGEVSQNKPVEPFVDPDDLPENQGKTPLESLKALKARLDAATAINIVPSPRVQPKAVVPQSAPQSPKGPTSK